jgi:hypothetical protein
MTWLEAIPAVTVAVLTFVLIGAPFAWAVGGRGITFLALAIGSSVSSVVVSSFLAPLVGLPWNLGVPFLVSLPLAAIGLLLRRRFVLPPAPGRPREWGTVFAWSLAAAAIGGSLVALSVLPAIGHPDNPSQTYDAIFHLNAVRWILDTSDASPLHMTMSTPAYGTSFYPTPWHAIVAFVVQLTGAGVVVASNAVAVATAAFVWPVASVFLARTLFGPVRLALVAAGILSAAFASFPIVLLGFGVLYPNLLAVALLPVALGLLVMALRQDSAATLRPVALWLVTLWVVLGMTVAHPNALFSLFALSAPLLGQACVVFVRRRRPGPGARSRAVLAITALLAAFAFEAFLWTRVATNDNAWRPDRPFLVSIAEAALTGPGNLTIGFAATLLVLTGAVITLFRRRLLWLTGSYFVAILLFAVANGGQVGALRDAITGLWYNDSFRLAALLPVIGVPLAVQGLLTIVRLAQRGANTALARVPASAAAHRATATAVALALLAIATLGTQFSNIPAARASLAETYRLDATSFLLSSAERDFFARVARVVPAGSVVAGNPWNGSSLVYAYTGRPALFPHVGGSYPQEYWDLAAGLAQGTPAACAAAADLGVRYVLDFGDRYVFAEDKRADKYGGITAVEDSTVLTVVAEEAGLKLYEVTGCAAS